MVASFSLAVRHITLLVLFLFSGRSVSLHPQAQRLLPSYSWMEFFKTRSWVFSFCTPPWTIPSTLGLNYCSSEYGLLIYISYQLQIVNSNKYPRDTSWMSQKCLKFNVSQLEPFSPLPTPTPFNLFFLG